MTATGALWSSEWARLGSKEISRRIRNELCETCGAQPTMPCATRNGRTSWEYRHAERMRSAMRTFNKEKKQ